MTRFARGAARAAARALSLVVLTSMLALPAARAGVSPFPPIDFGTVPVGNEGQYDFMLLLTIPFAAVPSSYDGVQLYVAANAGEELALAALGFTSPVTVGQVKTLMPAAGIVLANPTMSISGVTGNIGLTDLGCNASNCNWRVSWDLDTPGVFGAHLEVQVASVSIVNGGLLGGFLNLLYPLLQGFIGSFLHYDFVVTVAASAPAVPVPANDDAAIAMLGLALAALAARTLRRRAKRDGR